nr:hypothetical protein [Tanacetum cinerariifolium]
MPSYDSIVRAFASLGHDLGGQFWGLDFVFTTISNPLLNDDKINSNELNSHVQSNSIESTSNHDTVKFDNLDEFSGPLIPIHIAEEERIRREHAEYINHGEVDAIDDLRVDNSISNSEHEFSKSEDSDFDNPSIPLPPPEPPDEEFDFEIDFGNEISVVRNTIDKFEFDARVKFDVSNENDDLSYFMFVNVFSLLFAESEDTIFDLAFMEMESRLCVKNVKKLLEDLKELAEYEESLENSSKEIAVSNSNQKEEGPPQDSDIHQLIEECSTEIIFSYFDFSMRTRSSSNLIVESFTIPKRRNRRRSKQIVKPELRTIVETPIATMADTHTISELLQAPIEGYRDAIVIPIVLAKTFELKVGLLSLTTNLKNYITKFQQKFDETCSEATQQATVKAIEETCVTCGRPHPYYECLAAGGNTFDACIAVGPYNKGGNGYRPQVDLNYYASN